MKTFFLLLTFTVLLSCNQNTEKTFETPCPEEEKQSMATLKKKLTEKGFSTFDYVDEATLDTVLMQQYFMAFLKRGENRSQSKEEADSLQQLHMAHLGRMYAEGFADISGPFGDDGGHQRNNYL